MQEPINQEYLQNEEPMNIEIEQEEVEVEDNKLDIHSDLNHKYLLDYDSPDKWCRPFIEFL